MTVKCQTLKVKFVNVVSTVIGPFLAKFLLKPWIIDAVLRRSCHAICQTYSLTSSYGVVSSSQRTFTAKAADR